MRFAHVNPLTDSLWHTLIEQQRSTVFHSPPWIQALVDTYGLDIEAYVLIDREGVPQAGIPFCRVTDIMGTRIVSLPFSDYCDPLAMNAEQWQTLSDRLLAENYPITLRCLHNTLVSADDRFNLTKQTLWHGLDLRPDLDTLWRNLQKGTKWSIKKVQRDGVFVQKAETLDDLHEFFNMHLKLRKYKHQLLAQPYSFFEHIWHQFMAERNGALFLAMHEKQVIGGVLFLEWQNTIYYKFSASIPGQLSYGSTDALIWEGIKYAKAKGYTAFDFGLSERDHAGLVQYKRKFATEECTIACLRHVPAGASIQREQQVRSLLTELTNLFVDPTVPDAITDKAGQVLYRYFL